MSGTLAGVRNNVRWLLQDHDPSNYAVSTPELNRLIEHRMQTAAVEIGQGPAWVTAALTLVPDQSDYTLPTGVTYQQVMLLRLGSQGWSMMRISMDIMTVKRRGPAIPRGLPTDYTLWEDTSQVVNVRLFPTPSQADTIDIFRSLVPATLTDDSTAIPFSDGGLRLLELGVALRAAKRMTPEQRAQRLLSDDVIKQWEQDIETEKRTERSRINRLKRTGQHALTQA